MSQRRSNKPREEAEDISGLQEAIKECVRYILCREGSKIPIKHNEINNHLKTVCPMTSNQVNMVIVEANKILKRVYGYKLMQVEASSKQYIVVLEDECESILSSAVTDKHRKLLVAALMHIYMSGAPVKEDDMWKFLTEAGLLENNDKTGRDLLKINFTRQMYLQYSKVGEGDLAKYVFQWGQRAVAEVPKLFLLNKMAEAFEKTPDHWCEQFKEATQEAQS